MLQAEIYSYHHCEYIVIDTATVTMSKEGLARLSSYRHGVGADRIILVDKSLQQVIAVADSQGCYQLMTPEDYHIAGVALGTAGQTEDMRRSELHITEYFLQQLLPVNLEAKLAS